MGRGEEGKKEKEREGLEKRRWRTVFHEIFMRSPRIKDPRLSLNHLFLHIFYPKQANRARNRQRNT